MDIWIKSDSLRITLQKIVDENRNIDVSTVLDRVLARIVGRIETCKKIAEEYGIELDTKYIH